MDLALSTDVFTSEAQFLQMVQTGRKRMTAFTSPNAQAAMNTLNCAREIRETVGVVAKERLLTRARS